MQKFFFKISFWSHYHYKLAAEKNMSAELGISYLIIIRFSIEKEYVKKIIKIQWPVSKSRIFFMKDIV